MNLTCSAFLKRLLLFVNLLGALTCFAQLDGQELPKEYHYLLKGIDERTSALHNTFIVSNFECISDSSLNIVRRLDGWKIVRKKYPLYQQLGSSARPVNSFWKLSQPDLLNYSGSKLMTLKLINAELLSRFSSASIVYYRHPYAKVLASAKEILGILELDDVVYIGLESNQIQEESRVLDLNRIPNNLPKTYAEFPELKGTDIAVGIKEGLFDETDVDFAGRAFASKWASEQISNHATEMATIIGGNGVTFANGLGVAQEVLMYSSDFSALMPDVNKFYEDQKILIQNHSYGGEVESFYGAGAEAYDQISNVKTELLHIMSSGNSGSEIPTEGEYKNLGTWANLTGNYKNAKNSLVVGAVDTTGMLMTFSSVGPAADGRVKPDVVAYSTAGTSNATALVSGVAALLQEMFLKIYSIPAPSDLVKAFLINGAKDVGTPEVDFKTGYGNIDAYSSAKMLNTNQFFLRTLEKGMVEQMSFEIPENALNLKLTLVWNDPAGHANDLKPLVNDLDLKVEDPNGQTWLPWVLDHSANEAALESKAIRGEDHLNNVEQISIASPTLGTYHISVEGIHLFTDVQKFSVVFSYELKDKFEWMYPMSGNNVPYDGETASYFRWASTLGDENGDLYLSLDKGNTWSLLASKLDLGNGYFRWNPDGINSIARAKIKIGALEFESEDFVVSKTLTVKSGFNCEDSVMIQWSQQANVQDYEIMQWVNNEFHPLKTTSDTFVILGGDQIKASFLKVIPRFTTMDKAIGSYLFSPNDLGSDCYLSSFHGFKNDEGILLRTDLTSLYGIRSVSIEGRSDHKFQSLHSHPLDVQTSFEYQDNIPNEGVNLYRAIIEFENGSIMGSDTLRLIYLNETTALLYPNPVRYGSSLAIQTNLSGELQSTLRIFDINGHEHSVSKLSELEYITMDGNLIPGVYLYTIENEKGKTQGRFVVY